ncbi:amiloride-sensitive sodium channel subunit beta-like [Liolophura sinensis]|uniref:amiloride-sensitive sodium channel subunit beta-like n=1 Tax=Liolophura sinensis TaxID=3198878 RepID=UPI00315933C7
MAGDKLTEFVSNLNPEFFARSLEATVNYPGTHINIEHDWPSQEQAVHKRLQKERIANLSHVPTNYFDYYDEDTSEERAPLVELEQDVKATRVEMGHQLDDMLLYCSFEGRKCTQKFQDFTLFQTSDYGNCYKFNDASNGSNVRIAKRTGQTYGLQLILYTEVDEYIPGLALGYGMRLALSMHNTLPPITSEGMFISAGAETSIGIQLTNISRLGSPYGNCSSDGGDSLLADMNLSYTRTACQEICEPHQVYNKCGCYQRGSEEMYPNAVLSNTRPCNNSDITCINDMNETKQRNFVKVNVFYRDLNYETIQEGSDYPDSSFFSDLGGAIGLWVGFSVLGLLEVLQFLLEICYGCLKRIKRSDISASRDEENSTDETPEVKYFMSSTKTLSKTFGEKDEGKY